VRLLRAAWAEFDETAARVSADLRPGVRGGGRSRDQIVRHVLATEGGDFSKRVKAPSELEGLATPGGLAHHRDHFVEAMRDWYAEGKPRVTAESPAESHAPLLRLPRPTHDGGAPRTGSSLSKCRT